MSDYLTIREVAARFGCSPRKIAQTANQIGVGINLWGAAGWRFTETDVQQIANAWKPKPATRRDPRRRTA